jgi:GT2 family glycosyltransferase
MAVFDTEMNQRSKYTKETLASLEDTVDLSRHRIIIIDNDSCNRTKALLRSFRQLRSSRIDIITLTENIGTARAINTGWQTRDPGEHCIKMDNDVVIHNKGWVDLMEEVIARDNTIGQVGLKRKDCLESPETEGEYRSRLFMLPHTPGARWIVGEEANHIMGTCVMHSSSLLDEVGYLYQPGIYGFDDCLMSLRSRLSGFKSIFLPQIEIDHIDDGSNSYTKEKIDIATKTWNEYKKIAKQYLDGERDMYQEFY